jgi:hypothetical protein
LPHGPAFSFSLREAFFLPGGWGACSALARPRSLRASTPSATTRQCGPGWGPSVSANDRVPDTPPRFRTPGSPWPPETMAAPPARRIEYPPTQKHRSDLSSRALLSGRVGVRAAPRATGAISPAGAGTERASRSGVSLARSHANSEGPHRGASLLGRTRRRVGGLGSMPSPSDRSRPAGQTKSLHAVEKKERGHPGTGKTEGSRSEVGIGESGRSPEVAMGRGRC